MKKITSFLLASVLLMGGVSANETWNLVLVEEYYEGGGITRIYEDPKTQEYTFVVINVPEEIQEKVESSTNPLLESKKELTNIYEDLNLKERLAELNNEKLYSYDATTSVDKSLKENFEKDKKEAVLHSKETPKKEYDTTKEDYIDYSELEKKNANDVYALTDETSETVKETVEAVEKEKKKEETKEKINSYIPGLIGVIIFFGFLFLISRNKGV